MGEEGELAQMAVQNGSVAKGTKNADNSVWAAISNARILPECDLRQQRDRRLLHCARQPDHAAFRPGSLQRRAGLKFA